MLYGADLIIMVLTCCCESALQGHALSEVKPPWRNPVRWREIYGNFSTLGLDMPPLWGTVKDSVDSLLAVGIQPIGETPRLLTQNLALPLPGCCPNLLAVGA